MAVEVEPRGEAQRQVDERLRGARAAAVAVPGDPDQPRRDAVAEVDDRDRRVGRVDGQPRDDRDPDAGGDEALDGAVVVRAEDDVRLPAGLAQALLDALRRAARAVEISGWSTSSRRLGVRSRAASGEPAGTTRTYGSRNSSTVSYGPGSSGSTTKLRSSSPRSTSRDAGRGRRPTRAA